MRTYSNLGQAIDLLEKEKDWSSVPNKPMFLIKPISVLIISSHLYFCHQANTVFAICVRDDTSFNNIGFFQVG